MNVLTLNFKYTPAANNSYVVAIIETSDDPITETPTNWYGATTQSGSATEILAYANGGTSMGSGSGIPVIFPGSKTSTNGTVIQAGQDFEIKANWVRVRFLEVTGGAFGTLWVTAAVSDTK